MSPGRRKRLPKRPKMSVQKKDEKKDRFGSSRTALGTAWAHFRSKSRTRDDPAMVGKAEAGWRVLLRRLHTSAESDEICFDV